MAAAILNTGIHEEEDSLTWFKEKSGVMHEGLPVNQKLRARIPSVNPLCRKCQEDEESFFHCLFSCYEASETWNANQFPSPHQLTAPWRWWMTLTDLLRCRPGTTNLLELAAHTIWQIWKARNSLVFEGYRKSPAAVADEARKALESRQASP
ncbi:hypothetical protein PIB30_068018 [Stylosanthes scabra]|uniref:Reverse transcriptase zinc-binding domain-containing protein n=1 Tax=Stylosanthes scabra TaxID=79078 RepID=A0ABU6YN37_9FABA|nr:hypothetical protein [Stylosanthes scabra]